jgi:hypothetical protein
MKTYGGVEVYIHIFLTSALAGGEWSASRPGRQCELKNNHLYDCHMYKLIQSGIETEITANRLVSSGSLENVNLRNLRKLLC